tara:strand:- start:170 stop:535 length:366 start_codon:yes stop_codon:yes gene_type:complete
MDRIIKFFVPDVEKNNDVKQKNDVESLKEAIDKGHIHKIEVILVLTLIMAFVYYGLMKINKDNYNNNEKSKKNGWDLFVDALYFSVINATTVGFGDITPQTNLTKFISILHNVLNFVIMAL